MVKYIKFGVYFFRGRSILAIGYISNINGVINPIGEICKIAREYNVITVIDAAQAAPHIPLDVIALDCDFLAFSGHKILGPAGTGVLYGKYELLEALEPLILAGGTVDKVTHNSFSLKPLPHRLEPGTPNISGVLGLGAAVSYIQNMTFDTIMAHEKKLIEAMHESLGNLPGAKILSAKPGSNQIAVASVVPIEANIDSDALCQVLSDSFQIMTRSGFHCVHQLFNHYAFNKGAVRISAYIYNTVEDIYKVAEALRIVLNQVT